MSFIIMNQMLKAQATDGINIKDKKVKHIFSEILDADSAIQALGRKRRTSEDDTCTFYLKNYSGQAIQGLL